jgi:protein TonB
VITASVVVLHAIALAALYEALHDDSAQSVVPVRLIGDIRMPRVPVATTPAATTPPAPGSPATITTARAAPGVTQTPPPSVFLDTPNAREPAPQAADSATPSPPAHPASPAPSGLGRVDTARPIGPAGAIGPGEAPARGAPAAAGRVDLPSGNADHLRNAKPPYPRQSQRLGEQGQVVVQVFVGVDGAPQRAQIDRSSGYERLDQAALTAVMAWRFVPGKLGGTPEAMWFNVPIHFVLE